MESMIFDDVLNEMFILLLPDVGYEMYDFSMTS